MQTFPTFDHPGLGVGVKHMEVDSEHVEGTALEALFFVVVSLCLGMHGLMRRCLPVGSVNILHYNFCTCRYFHKARSGLDTATFHSPSSGRITTSTKLQADMCFQACQFPDTMSGRRCGVCC